MVKKTIKCLKCKKEMIVEVDKMGVPYQKICSACKRTYSRTCKGIAKAYRG